MSSYSSPSEAAVSRWTGVTNQVFGLTSGDFTTAFGEFLSLAEADIAGQVGSAFDGTGLTARQVLNLQQAVAYAVGALFCERAANEEAEGVNAPLLMEADALNEKADRFRSEAQRLASLVAAGGETLPSEIQHSFPVATLGNTSACSERTFTRQGTLW